MHCSTTVPSIWHCQSIDQANVSVQCVQCIGWLLVSSCHWCAAGILLPHSMPSVLCCARIVYVPFVSVLGSFLFLSPSSNGCPGAHPHSRCRRLLYDERLTETCNAFLLRSHVAHRLMRAAASVAAAAVISAAMLPRPQALFAIATNQRPIKQQHTSPYLPLWLLLSCDPFEVN